MEFNADIFKTFTVLAFYITYGCSVRLLLPGLFVSSYDRLFKE